jgi:hypothetical protein
MRWLSQADMGALVTDRASVVTNTIVRIIRVHGDIDVHVRREIAAILREEFDDVARTALTEIRLRDE